MRNAYLLIPFLITCSNLLTAQWNGVEQPLMLENLWGRDTLVIRAFIADCGEWGGHKEMIAIIRNETGGLKYFYERDTVSCVGSRVDRGRMERRQGDVSHQMERMVVLFIKELVHRSFLGNGEVCNGCASYVAFRTNKYRVFRVGYSDGGSEWTGFEELKRGLLAGN